MTDDKITWRIVVRKGLPTIVVPFLTVALLIVVIQSSNQEQYASASFNITTKYFLRGFSDPDVLSGLYATLYLTFKGLLIGGGVAAFSFLLLGFFPKVAEFAGVLVNGLRAIPLTLLIPFLGVLPVLYSLPPGMSAALPSKDPAYLIALGSFLYLLIGIVEGIENRARAREAIFKRSVGLTSFQYVRQVLTFEALVSVLPTVRITVLFSLVLAIVLEQVMYYPGVGRLILDKVYGATIENESAGEAMSLLLLVAILGVFLDSCFRILRRIVLRWD